MKERVQDESGQEVEASAVSAPQAQASSKQKISKEDFFSNLDAISDLLKGEKDSAEEGMA